MKMFFKKKVKEGPNKWLYDIIRDLEYDVENLKTALRRNVKIDKDRNKDFFVENPFILDTPKKIESFCEAIDGDRFVGAKITVTFVIKEDKKEMYEAIENLFLRVKWTQRDGNKFT